MNASPAGLRPTTQGLETAMLVATAERSRRLGRLSGHVLSSAPVAQQSQPPQQLAKGAVVKEATTLPNGTVVIRFDNGRELRPTAERNGLSVGEDAVFYDDPDERLHETLLPDGPINHSREEIGEMLRLIRIDRFAEVMQPAMARAGVDMLIYVMRIGRDSVPRSDNQFADEFGARCGVFVFTTLEDGGLETAVFDHTDRPVELLGAYDKVFKPSTRMTLDEIYRNYGHELNGDGRGTELEWRFEGLGDYVREHRPTTLALNFWEELGGALEYEPGVRDDGISFTDYRLLLKEIGTDQGIEIISAEHLLFDYISRPVAREIELCTWIRADCESLIANACADIVPGVTTVDELGDLFRTGYRKDGSGLRHGDTIEAGDLICFQAGLQSFNEDPYWPFGNVCDVTFEYAYVLEQGQTALPPHLEAAWAEGLKVRKILDANILPGRSALKTLQVLEDELTAAGYLFLKEQDYVYGDNRVQVPVDMHAAGKGYYAPRLGYLGPDWMREMILPLNHHFFNEYWVYSHVPEWGEEKYLSLQFHDGAFTGEGGTYYPAPHPSHIRLLRKKGESSTRIH